MTFRRKPQDIPRLEQQRKNQIIEEIKESKMKKKINDLIEKISPETARKNKGKFLKWLKLFKDAYGKKGVEFLLRQTEIDIIFGKQFVNKYNKLAYEFDCHLLKFLKQLKEKRTKNQEEMFYLDNICEFGYCSLDDFLLLAMAQFRRYIQLPFYSEI